MIYVLCTKKYKADLLHGKLYALESSAHFGQADKIL